MIAGSWGCLDDPTPESVRFRMDGPAGTEARVIFSTDFIAGRNQTGVTEVRIFLSDTITSAFPIDVVISILPNHIFFVQAEPVGVDDLSVSIRVDADDRHLFDGTGLILATDPWLFVYLFNVNLLTSNVDVVA